MKQLPDYLQSCRAAENKNPTALQLFIANWEPPSPWDAQWRDELLAVMIEPKRLQAERAKLSAK